MLAEVLRCLGPKPGDLAVDCTLGGGGHAQAILERIMPGGRLIGLDTDVGDMVSTMTQLSHAGFGADVVLTHHENFAALPQLLVAHEIPAADVILADLGVSAMQIEDPIRGFSYKVPGPLDMRMDRTHGETAAQLLARVSEDELAEILFENSDEPYAELIAVLLKVKPFETTNAVERQVRVGLEAAKPELGKADVKMSVRRTFQALRIAVNDELAVLDELLAALPQCLAPGGRVAILTFHPGEDRRVEAAFREGARAGVYDAGTDEMIRSTKEETFSNRRAQAAKLRWARRR